MDERMVQHQLGILRHALGVGDGGWERSYRNHYVTSPGSDDYAVCMALVEHGLMTRKQGHQLSGGGDVFFVTDIGRAAAVAPPPKTTRAQRRYRAYLDSGTNRSFIDWLRGPSGRAVH